MVDLALNFAFTALAAHTDFVSNLSYKEQPSYSRGGTLVSGNYFGVLGLKPALGRLIVPGDEPKVGESAVVVLSYGYWQRRFAGDPNIIGRSVRLGWLEHCQQQHRATGHARDAG